ncbi:zf-FYVE type zinc finger protein and glutamine sensor Pib2 [Schizosaccharomyces osmophilus]|uniref:Zf-FYVE type zinc finger protein and glutamine sensor Pib2 n=1 Tax=Schizosaccharomyces osmophilus TaxID=2545709 RepID=A0AAF0AXJ9_9SCHI|nr:zf-FYVE type zinc finger protein and glutamine sensor Pib2 [Schizosaccharomyces osmophilus]WBW74165.1 zf-FYVE type zinc finger protein and glutamine sensor Pib2 [Schizosaccharomyces osmophilus]
MTTVQSSNVHSASAARFQICSGSSPYTNRVRPSYELIEAPTRQATSAVQSAVPNVHSNFDANSMTSERPALPLKHASNNPFPASPALGTRASTPASRHSKQEQSDTPSASTNLSRHRSTNLTKSVLQNANTHSLPAPVTPPCYSNTPPPSTSSSKETGLPKDHWKPDSEAIICAFPSCSARFGLFERRHHCRCCGDVFCSAHCNRSIPLTFDVRFSLSALKLFRACVSCFYDYLKWRQSIELGSPSNVIVGTEPHAESVLENKQISNSVPIPKVDAGKAELPSESLVLGTVPDNWVWSTF